MAERLATLRPGRPRLHFDGAGIQALRARATGSHQRYADLLADWVQRHRNLSPPTHLPASGWNEVLLEECGAFVTNAALAALVTAAPADRELARRWALAMCEVGPLPNYGLGVYAAGLARAFDWLYDTWTGSERVRLRDHLARLVRSLYQGSIPGDPEAQWWAGAHLHHDFWIPVGGLGEAALAILEDVDDAGRWAARARAEFETAFTWLGDDGAWHEGAADWCYALAPLLAFFGAWQSVTGEDPHDLPWLLNTALFRLYHYLPDGSYVYLNDSFRSGRYNTSGSASCHLLRRLAALFRDGGAQWLAERDEIFDLAAGPKGVYQAPYEGSSYRAGRTEYPEPDAHCAAWNLLWYDPSVIPEPPSTLPRSRHFENLGLAVLRSGWSEADAVISLACGPLAGRRCAERVRAGESRSVSNFTHAHADYNSITLFTRGRYFLIPPGYARRSSHFQNGVAANGADFRATPELDLRIRSVVEETDFLSAVGDATAAFHAELGVASYHRHLVLRDGCLVLFDDVRLASPTARSWNSFQWSLHSDPAEHELSIAGSGAAWTPIDADAPRLALRILEPQGFAWERALLLDQDGAPMLEALRLVRPEWYSPRMQVLADFSWEERPSEPELLRGDQWLGVAWPERPERPAIAFATTAGAEIDQRAMGDRPLLLFGADPERPERWERLDG